MIKKNPVLISILLFFMSAHLNEALPPIDLTLKNCDWPNDTIKDRQGERSPPVTAKRFGFADWSKCRLLNGIDRVTI